MKKALLSSLALSCLLSASALENTSRVPDFVVQAHLPQGEAELTAGMFIPYLFAQDDDYKTGLLDAYTFTDADAIQVLDEVYSFTTNPHPTDMTKSPLFSYIGKRRKRRINVVGTLEGLDKYVFKAHQNNEPRARYPRTNAQRIIEAERLRTCVELNGLHRIVIPQKWLYHLPGNPLELTDDNYLVAAERLPILPDDRSKATLRNMTLPQCRTILDELFVFLALSGYEDAHGSNIRPLTDENNNIVAIAVVDAEALGYRKKLNAMSEGIRKHEGMIRQRAYSGMGTLARQLSGATEQYWRKKIDQLRNSRKS